MIGQLSGPYSPLRPAKIGFVAKLFCYLSPSVLNFYSKLKFKLSFTLNCVLNDFKLTGFAFEVRQKFDAVQRE